MLDEHSGCQVCGKVTGEDSMSSAGPYINVFDGFSTDLIPIRQQINKLVEKKRALEKVQRSVPDAAGPVANLQALLGSRCNGLLSD